MRLRHCLTCLFLAASSALAATNEAPKFDEVYKLLRENLSGVTPEGLDQAAVKGLIRELQPRVSLTGGLAGAEEKTPLSRSQLYDSSYQYFRVGQVGGDLPAQIAAVYRQASETNNVKGIILDLRFAGGTDYAVAGAVADQFISTEQPLLNWGTGSARSTQKTNAISVPVAILVNQETTGAAEALAAVLREAHVGLVIGATTAGQASVFKEFTLSDGSKLRIATAQVKLGEGNVLSQGVVPDIAIVVSLEDEKTYLKDPYALLHKPSVTETNQADAALSSRTRRRLNEAELVRQQHEGAEPEDETPSHREEASRPLIADPVLARALDLLKGLAVVQQGTAGLKGQ